MSARHLHPVVCLKGCRREWARDPIYEVACPTCRAGIGHPCVRPSGHGSFGDFHRERDIAADRAGAYGVCPLGRCGLANKAKPAIQPELAL